jgi:hypothetical protein
METQIFKELHLELDTYLPKDISNIIINYISQKLIKFKYNSVIVNKYLMFIMLENDYDDSPDLLYVSCKIKKEFKDKIINDNNLIYYPYYKIPNIDNHYKYFKLNDYFIYPKLYTKIYKNNVLYDVNENLLIIIKSIHTNQIFYEYNKRTQDIMNICLKDDIIISPTGYNNLYKVFTLYSHMQISTYLSQTIAETIVESGINVEPYVYIMNPINLNYQFTDFLGKPTYTNCYVFDDYKYVQTYTIDNII